MTLFENVDNYVNSTDDVDQICVAYVWQISGRSRAKNEDLLSITSETTFGLLLPTVAQ